MQIKHTILIFLIGLLLGIGVSPFTDIRPQQALKSPVPVTLAHMPQVITQLTPEPKILGVKDASEVALDDSLEMGNERKKFADLLIGNKEEVLKRTVLSDKKDDPFQEQKTVTIAVFGDSMVDTMGTGLPYLKEALAIYYPNVDFVLRNYGVGAQNVEQGLARADQSYSYHDRSYPPLTNSGTADIVIIGSFAYNPFSDKDINYHWTKLAELVNKIRNSGKQVLLLAENAPAKDEFGKGPNGVNWPQDMARKHAEIINQYLESTTKLASSLGIPLVDGYHSTLLSDNEGNQTYINQGDHIHPNVAGHQFLAQKIAERIWSSFFSPENSL